MSAFPARPRLAEHALPRRHLIDGEDRVVIHDARSGGRIVLDARAWGLLSCADGTRDLEGILAAAAREGARARLPALRAFLEQLHAAGLIEEGAAPPALPVEARPADAGGASPPALIDAGAGARPLDPLPDFSLRCDGRGSCCRIYPTVLFSPLETARARAALPLILDAGDQPARAFLPERGAGPTAASAVALVDGRCAYLTERGICGIHEAAGDAAKPLGCRLFPAALVDDGEAVRVSVAVECACVLASVGLPAGAGGAPILPGAPRTRADLDPAVHVQELPATALAAAGAPASRAALVAWSRAVLAAPAPADVPGALRALAAALERSGPDPEAARAALAASGPATPEDIAPWAEALARRARRRAAEDAAFRADRDLARRAVAWIAAAAGALLHPELAALALAAPPDGARRAEAFYLRAAIHGHQLIGEAPLADRLRDAAARLLVARAMGMGLAALAGEPDVEPRDDPASEHPLALVEAAMRGHGLAAYAADVAQGE